jgi:hypothetical protein
MKKKTYITAGLTTVVVSQIMRSMDSPPYFIGGVPMTAIAIWIAFRIITGRLEPNASKSGAVGLVFWFLGTGVWFFIIQFNLLTKYQITYLIAVQIISFIWIAPIVIFRKMKGLDNKSKATNEN